MLRLVVGLLLLIAGTSGALADVLDDALTADHVYGDFPTAIRLYSRALASTLSPERRDLAYNNRGLLYTYAGDHDKAIVDFDAALRLQPDDPIVYSNRALAYSGKGEFDKALADYGRSIELNPNLPVAHTNRGDIYFQLGEDEKAIADYDSTLKLQPDDVRAHNQRGFVHLYGMKHQYDKAIADFDAAIRLQPDAYAIRENRGHANFMIGRFDAAAADFTRAFAIDPSSAYAVLWLHVARARAGKDDHLELRDNAQILDRSRWPGPIVSYFIGEISVSAVRSAAENADAGIRRKRVCDADFFIGAVDLSRGVRVEARQLLQKAAAGCPPHFSEGEGARVELKRFGKLASATQP